MGGKSTGGYRKGGGKSTWRIKVDRKSIMCSWDHGVTKGKGSFDNDREKKNGRRCYGIWGGEVND